MTLKISGPAGELEASYHSPAQAQNAALLCHPHPSYGGSMHDNVLALTAAALDQAGSSETGNDSNWAHLRFNFRGVGESSGTYDDSVGEQDDLVAAWDWLRAQHNWHTLTLVGYSFGSAMAWSARERCEGLSHLVLIAPPTAAMPFSSAPVPISSREADPKDAPHIIVGDRDDYCNLDAVPASASLQVLPGADHFFSGSADLLAHAIAKALAL